MVIAGLQNRDKVSGPQLLFINHALLLNVCCTLLIISFLASILFVASALEVTGGEQHISLGSSESGIKGLLADANQTLKSGNVAATIQDLLNIQRKIGEINSTSSSVQASKFLIRQTMLEVVSGKIDSASSNLNLIYQQLFTQPPENLTSDITSKPQAKPITPIQSTLPDNRTSKVNNVTITNPLEKTMPTVQSALPSNETSKKVGNGTTMSFQTYENRAFAIKIQYPDSWSARGYLYNKAGNNTVVGFYSPSKTASQLGNISGVSGQFVPYLDIFVFDSKNMSLNRIIDGRMNRIQNTTDIVLESKPFTLKGNHPAHMLVYSTITGGDEFFKKMQVYTVFNNKVYLITFTAQEALFSNFLPVVQKMIDSFEV